MLFGHYVAWIAAGIMGAGTAALVKSTIIELDPGDVAYRALGLSGYVIVIVAGWTTANANLYRSGLAAQAIFHNHSRQKVTFTVGCVTVAVASFPFVFSQMLPMLTYAGLLVVPVGGIVFAEHVIFPRIGLTRYWAGYQKRSGSPQERSGSRQDFRPQISDRSQPKLLASSATEVRFGSVRLHPIGSIPDHT